MAVNIYSIVEKILEADNGRTNEIWPSINHSGIREISRGARLALQIATDKIDNENLVKQLQELGLLTEQQDNKRGISKRIQPTEVELSIIRQEIKRQLRKASHLSYYEKQNTSPSLLSTTPLQKQEITREFMAKKGVEFLNKRILTLVTELKNPDLTPETVKETIGELNYILGSAIHVLPDLVKSIEITIVRISPPDEEIFDQLYGSHLNGRFFYEEYIKTLQQNHQAYKYSLTFPFPYSFEKNNQDLKTEVISNCDIRFDYINNVVPCLSICLVEPNNKLPLWVKFTLDEIESIQFSDKEKFSPYLSYDKNGEVERLKEKPTYIDHYLEFRSFTKVGQTIYAPPQGKLWIIKDFLSCFTKLERGFIVEKDLENPENTTLYEFENINFIGEHPDISALKLLAKLKKGDKKLLKKTKQYQGNAIIQRLAQIQPRKKS